MTTTPTAPLTLEAAPEHSSSAFPARILSLLRFVAERNPPEGQAPYEDEYGEPMQDDAEAAIRWISKAQSALTAQSATIDQLEARLREAEADARRWDFVRHHWSHAQMRWNNDATNSLKSIVLTIKTAHWTSAADAIESQIDTAIAAHGKDEA